MKCVIKRPYAKAHKTNISNDLETLQGIVNGNIEVLPIPTSDFWLICNEDGKMRGLDANIYINEYNDAILGSIIIVDANMDGEFIDMNDADADAMVKWLNDHDAIELARNQLRSKRK